MKGIQMIRNFKALGLALVAVLAMSAVVASAAQATGKVTATEGGAVVLKGEQVGANTLTVGGVRTVSCSEAKLEKALAAGEQLTTVTNITAKYDSCTGNGETTATVNMTSCTYTLESTVNEGATGKGTAKIACSTAGDGIDVDIYEKGVAHETAKALCRYKIPAQTLGNQFVWHNRNVGTATEDIELTLSGLSVGTVNVVAAKSAIACGKATGGVATGSYSGTVTVKGFAGEVQKKVMIG
jgi:hypothetical protein